MSANGATILGCEGVTLSPAARSFYREADPWGFILFARNVDSPDQLRRLTGDLRDAVGRNSAVFVDQEGGRVQRLRAPHWREWSPPLDTVRRAGDLAPEVMRLQYAIIAAELRAVGIDGNCAPSLDIAQDHTHPFLQNRCYGNALDIVVRVAREVANGLLDGGVLPVMKHMPGHGRAAIDTHHELPRVTETAEVLHASDFAAFKALNDLPIGMTAHIVFSAFDEAPSTCSARMIDLIRSEIGFGGLLMTDDLSMQALAGSLAERAIAARRAGCDIVLHCNGKLEEMREVVASAGRLDSQSAKRAQAALGWRSEVSVSIPDLDRRLVELMAGVGDG